MTHSYTATRLRRKRADVTYEKNQEKIKKSYKIGGFRQTLQALSRVINTDRRLVALLGKNGEILLSNAAARALDLSQDLILSRLDWPVITERSRRAGTESLVWECLGLEGELVHIPLGQGEGFLLRLAQSEQESLLLRNRSRAATLLRAAHDLRSPIQSLVAASHQLETDPNPHAREALRRSADRALNHISNVLALLRGTQLLSEVEQEFRLADEVNELLQMLAPLAQARASTLSLNLDFPQNLTLSGPLQSLRALLQNLIDNSLNHGGGQVNLDIKARPVSLEETELGLWSIEILLTDEGLGLSEAAKAKLDATLGLRPEPVEPSASLRPSAGLTVLGHALTQLGARLTVQDRGSNGAPLKEGHKDRVIGTIFKVVFELPRLAMAAPVPMTNPTKELSGLSLLLVEDSPTSRDWLGHVLQSAGAKVHLAGTGAAALALLSQPELRATLDLILTDITLPRMSGIELAQRITTKGPALAQPWNGPIMGLTAHADALILQAAKDAGMAGVLIKPIPPAALIGALLTVLGKRDGEFADGVPLEGEIFNESVVEALLNQMGKALTLMFMQRSLNEVQLILQDLRNAPPEADTARRLHAATGSAGLTGLSACERALRALEQLCSNPKFKPKEQDLAPLQTAIMLTQLKLKSDLLPAASVSSSTQGL